MTPNHANKKRARYRYYMSRKDKERLDLPVVRVPAGDIESLIVHQVRQHADTKWDDFVPSREQLLERIQQVVIHPDHIEIRFMNEDKPISIAASMIRCSKEKRIVAAPENYPHPRRDPALIKLIVRAYQAKKALANPANKTLDDAATSMRLSTPYYCVLLRLAYLAPDITSAILEGAQPAHLNRQRLARINNLPLDWAGQREMLGFA
jgi:hypothetical protein